MLEQEQDNHKKHSYSEGWEWEARSIHWSTVILKSSRTNFASFPFQLVEHWLDTILTPWEWRLFRSAPLALDSALGNFFRFHFSPWTHLKRASENIMSTVAEHHLSLLSSGLKFECPRVILHLKESWYLLVQIGDAFVKSWCFCLFLVGWFGWVWLILTYFISSAPYANVLNKNSLQNMTLSFWYDFEFLGCLWERGLKTHYESLWPAERIILGQINPICGFFKRCYCHALVISLLSAPVLNLISLDLSQSRCSQSDLWVVDQER